MKGAWLMTDSEREMLKEPVKKVRWLTDREREHIIIDRKQKMKIKDIAVKYSVTAKTVHNVINRFNREIEERGEDGSEH